MMILQSLDRNAGDMAPNLERNETKKKLTRDGLIPCMEGNFNRTFNFLVTSTLCDTWLWYVILMCWFHSFILLLTCFLQFFIYSTLELLTQFLASNDQKYFYLWNLKYWIIGLTENLPKTLKLILCSFYWSNIYLKLYVYDSSSTRVNTPWCFILFSFTLRWEFSP